MPAIVSTSEYLALPRAPETWLIEGLLPTGGAMLIFGDPKVGKSYAALQLASALSTGGKWLGFPVPQATPVTYIQLDTPRTLWATRVQELVDSGMNFQKVYQADRETLECNPFNILNPEHFLKLSEALKPLNAGAVIIDVIKEAHNADENDASEMQPVIAHLDAAVKPAALILVSHARKANPERGYDLMNDNRGSNYIVGRMDAICRFSKSSMRCTSRTLEEHSTKLERLDNGCWQIAGNDPFDAEAELMMQAYPDLSVRELARKLAEKVEGTPYERSESAARAYIRRKRQ